MNPEEKIQGLWWLSDKPENKVSGDLYIIEGKLELNGSLEGIKTGSFGGSKIVQVRNDATILGISKAGGKYTLEFFDEPSFSMSFPGYKSDIYSLGNIFEGAHFPQANDLAFSKYYVEFPYLFEWINDGIISTEATFTGKKKNSSLKEVLIKIERQKNINIFKNEDFKLSCLVGAEKIPLSPSKEINISQTCVFRIEANKKPLEINDLYSVVAHLERFLMIAVGRTLQPIGCQTVKTNGKNSTTIQIFPHFFEHAEYKKILPTEMNFTFADIKSDSQDIFKNWFLQKQKHQDAFDLFSSINASKSKNLNNQFKDIISAIEGYVRVQENDLTIDLHKAIKTINEAVPKNDRPLRKADCDKIRVTRNKLSHIVIESGEETNILNNKEKWIFFDKLKFLLEYSLLKDLGMSEALLKQFLDKSIS